MVIISISCAEVVGWARFDLLVMLVVLALLGVLSVFIPGSSKKFNPSEGVGWGSSIHGSANTISITRSKNSTIVILTVLILIIIIIMVIIVSY